MIIIITGTPGTGKTAVSKELVNILNKNGKEKFKLIHLNDEILSRKLWSSVDKKRKSKNADMRKLKKFISEQSKENKNLVIESHLAHYFGGDLVFVLRAGINELRNRMKMRGWSEAKIEENLEAERLNLILGESLDIHGSGCIEIDTTGKTAKAVAKRIMKSLGGFL
ncbi:MAG: adenylate kinase family protein [Candidatus Aenigmarchaeota archaeon]|nr:adenylate kinase family protein [Candidatus Aenigmarchaeota archaeon]